MTDHEPIQAEEGLAAAMVAWSDDAIISKDLQSQITSWNLGAERLFGYTAREMLGASIMRVVPPALHDEQINILERIRRGDRIDHFETVRQTKHRGLIDVSITVSPIKDPQGRIIGASKIARDITELKRHEREIIRLSRLYGALSEINRAIIRISERDALFERVCWALVEQGGFRAVWIAWEEADTHYLRPVAMWGETKNYLRGLELYSDERWEGQSPTGTAFREDRPYISNDVMRDPATEPWRGRMDAAGWCACAAFPIRLGGKPCAILTVYSEQRGFFQGREVELLLEAANNISFALDNFAREDVRRRTEEAIRQERDFSTALINSLPGVLYVYDRTGRFLRWNDNFESATGYDSSDIQTMIPTEFFPEEDRELIRSRIADVFENGTASVEATLLSKDGRKTPYYFTGVRVEIDGDDCVVGVGLDITERKEAANALRAAEDSIRQSQAELTRVARISVLGEFASSIGHEINQPLAAIVTNSGAAVRWLERTPPNVGKTREAIDRIHRDSNLASDVIKRLRALVTKNALEYADLDLNRALEEVLVFASAELRTCGIVVCRELDESLPLVHGDRIQLQQVLLNLVMNGIDAMRVIEDRAGILTLRSKAIDSGTVIIEVEDNGIGVDPATAARLFERFFTTKDGGTGLGLSISRSIVEAHGGRLQAASGSPFGAIFRFTLPAAGTGSP
jgi:PAS domain S-box-containing protein